MIGSKSPINVFLDIVIVLIGYIFALLRGASSSRSEIKWDEIQISIFLNASIALKGTRCSKVNQSQITKTFQQLHV